MPYPKAQSIMGCGHNLHQLSLNAIAACSQVANMQLNNEEEVGLNSSTATHCHKTLRLSTWMRTHSHQPNDGVVSSLKVA
ncbi:hypothetical protein JOQ06_019336 [Pogonophryne albipinna]|uniref:Uncharacterized protein n=1 Tax=Pogonophryne albipinna TaxID=1090488 RepID=A0AAD6AT21_9TELE|nr:hypothetical protein JOQ06_019336 [Pogonophryne albipinna]